MTKNYYKPSNYTEYYTDHTTFGGTIYNYDFDGYTTMSDMAIRIESDKKFDEKCRKNAENVKSNIIKNKRKI